MMVEASIQLEMEDLLIWRDAFFRRILLLDPWCVISEEMLLWISSHFLSPWVMSHSVTACFNTIQTTILQQGQDLYLSNSNISCNPKPGQQVTFCNGNDNGRIAGSTTNCTLAGVTGIPGVSPCPL
jgi:hypothetical protein